MRPGLRGIRREEHVRTTVGDRAEEPQPADLVERHFGAAEPNQLGDADLSYIRTLRLGLFRVRPRRLLEDFRLPVLAGRAPIAAST
jgi:hypothetical protein